MTMTEMQGLTWHEVVSSNIRKIAWSAQTLYITFKDGDVYAYDGVDTDTFSHLLDANSVGSYFHSHIRDQYPTRKL